MRIVLYISFLFWAMVTWAQRPYVELIVTPNEVEVNQPFNLTVKSNIQGENIKIETPEGFEDGRSVMNRLETEYDMGTRELVTYIYYSKSGTIAKSGKYIFGPAYVRKGNKVYRSNKVEVHVKEYIAPREADVNVQILRKPAAGQVLCSKKECYEGEAVCLQAQVLSKFNPTHYESYDTYKCEPITEEHEFDQTSQVTVRLKDYGRYERFVFELDKKVIFPTKAGKMVVQPFDMMLQSGFDSYPVHSSGAVIVVKKLPENAPKSFCGLVGNMQLKDGAKDAKCMKGDVITYEVSINGVGNLQDLSLPKLCLTDGFELYGDPEIKEKFSYCEEGAKGSVTWKYFLKCSKVGEYKSPSLEMAFFDPKEGKYKTIKNSPAKWVVLETPVIDEQNQTPSEMLVMEKYNDTEATSASSTTATVFKWVGYSSPFCLAFLFLLFRAKKKTTPEESQSVQVEETQIEEDIVDPIADLKAKMGHVEVKDFLYQAVHCIDELLSIRMKGELGWSISQDELNEAVQAGMLNEEQVFQIKYLKSLSDNCRYGGVNLDLSKEEILQKVENLKIQG